MPSVDIVTEIDSAEILNATHNTERELSTRFDFRGVDASISLTNDIGVGAMAYVCTLPWWLKCLFD